MIRQFELVERVARYNRRTNEALLNKAYVYGMKKHGNQRRASGDPYFSHPLEVAAILTDMRLDDATIAVALLHDTIEDTDATRTEIDSLFGPEIGALVEGLTKIDRLDLVSKEAAQGENLRKLLLAVSDDVRVLLVKLADRLHNMRTLHYVPAEKRHRIAEETRDIYAPLAGRIGMQEMREEFEDLAFKTLNQEAYDAITKRLNQQGLVNKQHIEIVIREISEILNKAGISAKISGREKQPFSIFKKLEKKGIAFEQLSDIYGFRILVDSVACCYQTLGILHTTWRAIPGRFKDFISNPKDNDYRSLHTTLAGPSHQRVEIQIRTHEMHDIAEFGVAAHALYKDGADASKTFQEHFKTDSYAYKWLKNTITLLAKTGSAGEGDEALVDFLENTKLELFQDQVFCFTPKGRLISLPRGANSIDFAYALHTDIGDSCVGTKINGKIMPLITHLNNGDQVEILRSSGGKPLALWENLVVTGKARAAIRRATRAQMREQYAGLGRQLLLYRFEKLQKTLSEDLIEEAATKLGFNAGQILLAHLGRGEIGYEEVIGVLFPELSITKSKGVETLPPVNEGWFGIGSAAFKFRIPGLPKKQQTSSDRTLAIRGMTTNLPVVFAPNGGAVPGDRIVGILEPGVGVTIYPIHSPSLGKFEDKPEMWLDVRWDSNGMEGHIFPARLLVSVLNEPGTLALIAQIIADHGSNIERLELIQGASDFTDIEVDLLVKDLKVLTHIVVAIRRCSVVSCVTRVNK